MRKHKVIGQRPWTIAANRPARQTTKRMMIYVYRFGKASIRSWSSDLQGMLGGSAGQETKSTRSICAQLQVESFDVVIPHGGIL